MQRRSLCNGSMFDKHRLARRLTPWTVRMSPTPLL